MVLMFRIAANSGGFFYATQVVSSEKEGYYFLRANNEG